MPTSVSQGTSIESQGRFTVSKGPLYDSLRPSSEKSGPYSNSKGPSSQIQAIQNTVVQCIELQGNKCGPGQRHLNIRGL